MTIALLILLALFCILLCALIIVYRITLFSPVKGQDDDLRLPEGDQFQDLYPKMREMITAFQQVPFQPVSLFSSDGLRLAGKLYEAHGSKKIAICVHGYRGTSIRDFCGGAPLLISQGYTVILIDQRAHGQSEGHSITFGIRERQDVVSWSQWAVKTYGEDSSILLYGISMGAASVLMTSSLALPSQVRGIVADCPYDSPKDILKNTIRTLKLPVALLWPFVYLAGLLFAHVSLTSASASDAVSSTRLPILIMHGEQDRLVPCEMSAAIAKAGPTVQRNTFPGADHGLSFLADRERYVKLLSDFTASVLE